MKHLLAAPIRAFVAAAICTIAWIAAAPGIGHADDVLPSWNEGHARDAIVDFVAAVTDESGPDFVAPEDRIATFDNDGTLWVERPTYSQVFFMFERIQALAAQHPDWSSQQPFQAVLENDHEALANLSHEDILTLAGAAFAGTSQDDYEAVMASFLENARDSRWDRPYTELVYQPMLELMDYLRDNDFHVFIVSGGGRDFIRMFSEPVYGVGRDDVIGTGLQGQFEPAAVGGTITRLPDLVPPVDDGPGKPVHIQRTIGRRPIIAVGNSDGDMEMLRFAESEDRPWLALLVHHDDAEREYAYDQRTENALPAAAERGWTVVSMRDDFLRVFPFDSQ